MNNTSRLIEILAIANEIGNENLVKETVIALGRECGVVTNSRGYRSLRDITLYSNLRTGSRIQAIKEIRARAQEYGLECGLKDAKDEIDRRVAELGFPENDLRY